MDVRLTRQVDESEAHVGMNFQSLFNLYHIDIFHPIEVSLNGEQSELSLEQLQRAYLAAVNGQAKSTDGTSYPVDFESWLASGGPRPISTEPWGHFYVAGDALPGEPAEDKTPSLIFRLMVQTDRLIT